MVVWCSTGGIDQDMIVVHEVFDCLGELGRAGYHFAGNVEEVGIGP